MEAWLEQLREAERREQVRIALVREISAVPEEFRPDHRC